MELPLHTTSDRNDLRRLQRAFSKRRLDVRDTNLRVLLPYRLEWERDRLGGTHGIPAAVGEISTLYHSVLTGFHASDCDLLNTCLRARPMRSLAFEPSLTPSHSALPPAAIERALSRFSEWLASPSWIEMHALERLVLGQVRLLEIWPITELCEAVVSVWLSGVATRSGLLLPTPCPTWSGLFESSLEKAFQMDTALLYRFHLESCVRAYELVEESL